MRSLTRWGVVAAALFALVGYTTPTLAVQNPALPLNGCLAGKIKCAGKKKACILGLYKKGFTADPAKLAKCHDGFQANPAIGKSCFEKLDAKGGCPATGDAAATEAKVDAFIIDLLAEMNPNGDTGSSKCQNPKVGCMLKYDSCMLGLFSKAAKAGGTVADFSKCTGGLSACISKLETKYPAGSGVGLECQTYADIDALRNKDDAFLDDLIAELATGNSQNSQRCSGDTSVHCTSAPGSATGCGGPLGTCEFWFGSPLALAAGGVTTCVTNQWAGGISGTFDQQSGASAGTASVIARVYNGLAIASPCPRCVGDGLMNDGNADGTCSGGGRNGQACDGNGSGAEPTFGVTSLDCPPAAGGLIATLPVDLTNQDFGTVSKVVDGTSPLCNGAPGKRCLCATCSGDSSRGCDHDSDCAAFGAGTCTNAAGEPRKPNGCVDDSNTPMVDGSICASAPQGEGVCPDGPVNQHCHIETFRGCLDNTDCTGVAGDSCDAAPRDCFFPSGSLTGIGDAVSASGSHGSPRNHANTQQFASVFCIAPTSASAVNAAAGLPGPGRLALGGVGVEDGTSGSCPTLATFVPTDKRGVLDSGWTGIGHDAKVISGGKVTVSVTGCAAGPPNCGVCTYTGPIQNPNAP